jgi:hypothetical protein
MILILFLFFLRRSLKAVRQTLKLRKDDWSRKRGMFAAISPTGEGNYKQPPSQKLPETVEHDVSITVNQQGDWTVAIPQEAEVVSENQAPKSKEGIVALDPGVRCFQTLYAPNHGYVMEWGAY